MGTGSFSGVKRPGCGVDHPPASSAEVKERVELHLYSTFWAIVACSKVNCTCTFYVSSVKKYTPKFRRNVCLPRTTETWINCYYTTRRITQNTELSFVDSVKPKNHIRLVSLKVSTNCTIPDKSTFVLIWCRNVTLVSV
jgi:hypothetical protein